MNPHQLCSPFSQESGDLISPSNQSGSELLPSSSTSLSNKSSSAPTSQQSQSTEISESLIAENFSERMDALMSLRAGLLVNLRACLESGWELPTTVGSGMKASDWWANYDPTTRCLKTRQPCLALNLDGPSMESSVAWPRSGTMVGGMLFQPQPLEPVIGGNDCASYLPTPTGARIGNDITVLEATDQRERANKLGQAVGRHFLPTPTTSTGGAEGNREGKTGGKLITNVQNFFLPTPIANDGTGSQYCYGPPVPEGQERKKILKLRGKVLDHFLPTPTTRDYKDTPGMATEAADGRVRDDQMPRRVYQTFAAGSQAQTGGSELSPAFLASLPKCRMGHQFLSWLMGYPVNWLKPLVSAQGTLFAPRRGSQSPKRSTTPSKPADPLRPF